MLIVRVTVDSSISPAALVTTSRLYGLVESVTEKVVAVSLMSPLGVTLSAETDRIAAP